MALFKYQIVIPARGGSKRFPGKNVALLNNIPLIAHSIMYGSRHGFKQVWVNTDSDEISAIAKNYGAAVVTRPASLAGDVSPTVDVLNHQLDFFAANRIDCDAIVLLQATNPLRPEGLLTQAISIFEKTQRKSLATFSDLNKKFGRIMNDRFEPANYRPGQRMQDLERLYFENGLLYITSNSAIRDKQIITADCFPLIENSLYSHIDIDLPEDIYFAEFISQQNILHG